MNSVIILGNDEHAFYGAAVLAHKCPWLKITLISDVSTHEGSYSAFTSNTVDFFDLIGMSWRELLFSASGTFKLANYFAAGSEEDGFFQGNVVGADLGLVEFHHIINTVSTSFPQEKYEDYSISAQAAKRGKYIANFESVPSLHYDLAAFCRLLKMYVENLGVICIDGRVSSVEIDPDQHIRQVSTELGTVYSADFYLDSRAEAPRSAFECESFGAVNSGASFFNAGWCLSGFLEEQTLYRPVTEFRRLANECWIKQTPLQSRTVVELYGVNDIPQNESHADIFGRFGVAVKQGSTRLKPNTIGRRKIFWSGNLLLIGTAACATGNLAFPALDVTKYQMEQFIKLFPAIPPSDKVIAEYNRVATQAVDNVLDYHQLIRAILMGEDPLNTENFSPALKSRMSLFNCIGRYEVCENELISKEDWIAFFMGLKLAKNVQDPLIGVQESASFPEYLSGLKAGIAEAVNGLPNHLVYLSQVLKSRNER